MDKVKFAIFALCLIAGSLAAAMAVDSYTVTPSTLKPGEEGSVQFTIKNAVPAGSTSTSSLEDVQIFYAAVPGVEFKTPAPFIVGTIESGGSAPVSIPFRILPGAKGGIVTAAFFVSQKEETQLKTVNVDIRVVNPPILSISSNLQSVKSTDTLKLTITNNGGKADKVNLKLAEGSGFAFIGTTSIYVGSVEKAATVDVQLDSRNADEGVNSIPFILEYQQEGGSTANETKYLTVAVKKEKADVVFTQVDPVVTGRDNVLRLKVKNTGRALEDFKFYLEDEKIKARESKLVRLGNLGAAEEKEIAIAVSVDAQPGVRNTAVTLKWVEDDVEKEEETAVQVSVNSDADVGIFIDAKPTPLVSGGEHTLSVLVSNVGSYKIQNVEVSLPPSSIFELFNAQQSQYIGGLESDDFSTVQYKVRMKGVQPGAYPVNVLVKYKDQSGVWVEKNQTSMVNVRPAEDAAKKENGSLLPLLIVIAVGGGAAYWWFRIRNKTAKKAS
ncbi:MAG: hypothetical protein QW568_03880 [Candidatus Anstonellaceae archaeon]